MDRLDKFLKRLTTDERVKLEKLLLRIKQRNIANLDVKRLRGYRDVYRVRAGDVRVIYQRQGTHIKILDVSHRDDNTYNRY